MDNELKTILRYIITFVIIVLAIKFFIWALPVILVIIIGIYLYNIFVRTKDKVNENLKEETKVKEKKITKTIDAEVVREKNED